MSKTMNMAAEITSDSLWTPEGLDQAFREASSQERHDMLMTFDRKDELVPNLQRILEQDPNSSVRYAALQSLKRVSTLSPHARVAALAVINAAGDPEDTIRHVSVIYMQRFIDREPAVVDTAVKALTDRALRDASPYVQSAAMDSLMAFIRNQSEGRRLSDGRLAALKRVAKELRSDLDHTVRASARWLAEALERPVPGSEMGEARQAIAEAARPSHS